MSESDWKQLSRMVPELRERYLKMANTAIARLLTDTNNTATDAFWNAHEHIERESRILHDCLDDIRRSTMIVTVTSLYRNGLMDKSDLEQFSDELKQRALDLAEGLE